MTSKDKFKKLKGAAGLHGIQYQKKILTWFAIRACEKNKIVQLSTEDKEISIHDDTGYEDEIFQLWTKNKDPSHEGDHENDQSSTEYAEADLSSDEDENDIFHLSTENVAAHSFDDIVYESKNEVIFGQAKHSENSEKMLSWERLITSKGDFSVLKYLKSFFDIELDELKNLQAQVNAISFTEKNNILEKISELHDIYLLDYQKFIQKKDKFKVVLLQKKYYKNKQLKQLLLNFFRSKRYILFTNLKIYSDDEILPDCSKSEKNNLFKFERFSTDFILCEKGELFSYYTLKKESFLQPLKDTITTLEKTFENSKICKNLAKKSKENKKYAEDFTKITESHMIHFLEIFNLIFVDNEDIDKYIKNSIESNKIFYDKLILENIEKKIELWFKGDDSYYLKPLDLISYFSEVWSERMREKLATYFDKIKFSNNCKSILEHHIVNYSILVIKTEKYFLLLIKLLQELHGKENKQLFVDLDLDVEFQIHMIKSFEHRQFEYLFCVILDENKEYLLTEIKNVLKKINCSKYHHKKKIVLLTIENIALDCEQKITTISDNEFFKHPVDIARSRTEPIEKKEDILYINRFLNISGSGPIHERQFLKHVTSVSDQKSFVISGDAGVGKTTFFNNFTKVINRTCSNIFAVNIQINRYAYLLQSAKEKNISLKLKDFSQLQNKDCFSQQVLKLPNSIILIIDGFDEIGPNYTFYVIEFIKKVLRQENVKNVLVSTRPKFQSRLERVLNVKAICLQEFTSENQLNLIWKYWKSVLKIKENKKNECYAYCRRLVRDFNNNLFSKYSDKFILVPLRIRIIAEISIDYCNTFLKNSNTLEDINKELNLAKLYELFLKRKQDVLVAKSNAGKNQITKKIFDRCLIELVKDSEKMAIRYVLDQEKYKLLGIDNGDPSSYELLYSMGLLTWYRSSHIGNFYEFVHKTIAEYLVANFIWKKITNDNQPTKAFLEFFIKGVIEDRWFGLVTVRRFLNEIVTNKCSDISEDVYKFCSSVVDDYIEHDYLINLFSLVEDNQLSILKLLLKKSNKCTKIINENYNIYGKNLLHLASDNLEILNFLCEKGGDANKMTSSTTGETLLHITSNPDVVEYLIRSGICVDTWNKLGYTPLLLAVKRKNFKIIETLLRNGANPNHTKQQGQYTVKTLTQFDVPYDISDLDDNEITPLHVASQSDIRIMNILIENGTDVNIRNIKGETAVHYAIRSRHVEGVKCLLNANADIHIADNIGETPLHYAAASSDFGLAKILIENGASVNIRNKQGKTAIYYAIRFRNVEAVKCFLIPNADVNTADNEGITPLHYAASLGAFDLVKILIESGADINAKNKEGRTALHIAVILGNLDITRYLIDNRININLVDGNNRTALYFANLKLNSDISKLLIRNGANIYLNNERPDFINCTCL